MAYMEKLFDVVRDGVASVTIFEDQAPGSVEALLRWANKHGLPVVERRIPSTSKHRAYIVHRITFGIHQIIVYGNDAPTEG